MASIVYVIGHRNPDTDSCVSASAYAYLKRALGMRNCVAARAGKMNPQTEYVFERFGLAPPVFLPDLVPRVKFYMGPAPSCIPEDMPLWDALAKLNESGEHGLPIVDSKGVYRTFLHYSSFARNILKKINPHKKAVIPTTVAHIIATIQAQPVAVFDENDQFKAQITVAALDDQSFRNHLDAEMKGHKVVIVGDREDIQRYAIESGVRAVIVTNGYTVSREIRELAEKKRVSVIISPYDTSSTSLLVIYSTPVSNMGDDAIVPLDEDEHLKHSKTAVGKSPARALPVVDASGIVTGMLDEGDFIKDPNIEVILVDHNEPSQAIEGIENYRILEIIDHHRLGTVTTKYPITFINKVVGATCTIVAGLFREQKVPLTKELASILLCGILSDTLVLKSATTSETDRETAEYLSNITDLDIEALGSDILTGASSIGNMRSGEIVRLDMKEYVDQGKKFSVSQIEVASPDEISERAAEIVTELDLLRSAHGYYFSSLMVTDITDLSSTLFVAGDKEFVDAIKYPKLGNGSYQLKDVLSRKKQLVPVLTEIIEKTAG